MEMVLCSLIFPCGQNGCPNNSPEQEKEDEHSPVHCQCLLKRAIHRKLLIILQWYVKRLSSNAPADHRSSLLRNRTRNKAYFGDRAVSAHLKVPADLEHDNPKFALQVSMGDLGRMLVGVANVSLGHSVG